jgi:DNA-binding response OmpR family regulator
MRRPLRILIGNCQDAVSDKLSTIIDYAFESRVEIRSVQVGTTTQLLDWARKQEYDLFLVVLNNLIVGGPDDRLRVTLELVNQLKAAYRKPVIAMGPAPDASLFKAKAIRAGADAFFPMPFDVAEFVPVVRKLLGSDAGRCQLPHSE